MKTWAGKNFTYKYEIIFKFEATSSFFRFVCPHCDDCTNIFSSEGGASLASVAGIPLLGTLPIDPKVGELAGKCTSVFSALPESRTAKIFHEIIDRITNK